MRTARTGRDSDRHNRQQPRPPADRETHRPRLQLPARPMLPEASAVPTGTRYIGKGCALWFSRAATSSLRERADAKWVSGLGILGSILKRPRSPIVSYAASTRISWEEQFYETWHLMSDSTGIVAGVALRRRCCGRHAVAHLQIQNHQSSGSAKHGHLWRQ